MNTTQEKPKNHQGYQNHETFGMAQIILTDGGQYQMWLGVAQDQYHMAATAKDRVVDQSSHARFRLAEVVKAYFEESCDKLLPADNSAAASAVMSLFYDGFGEVNWDEIADELLDKAIQSYKPHKFPWDN
jgi:hypothetical protein